MKAKTHIIIDDLPRSWSSWPRDHEAETRRKTLGILLVAVVFLASWQLGAWLFGVCCTGGAPADFILSLCRRVPFLAFLIGAGVCRLAEELIWPGRASSHWPYLLIVVAVAGACGHMLWPH